MSKMTQRRMNRKTSRKLARQRQTIRRQNNLIGKVYEMNEKMAAELKRLREVAA